jgi:hypothetical protein
LLATAGYAELRQTSNQERPQVLNLMILTVHDSMMMMNDDENLDSYQQHKIHMTGEMVCV